ncbi:DUF4253 domain-containing protein [Streptomyces sp. NPDC026672]|uniref:DUF4253 domain-containing protein n=1 Tax=unclassified Streptomyces TaxID=2593676 RepID=UPI0033D3C35D
MATLPNPLPSLAGDPSGRSLGLSLPPGRLIDTTLDGPWSQPLLWQADTTAAPGGWTALGTPAGRVGLLPVLVDAGDTQGGPQDWELAPGETSYPGDHDPEEVLAEYWEYWEDEEEEEAEEEAEAGTGNGPAGGDSFAAGFELAELLAPFGPEWPGLAPGHPRGTDPAEAAAAAARLADSLTAGSGSGFKDLRLALVPARRSADVPAALGWSGPLNHENDVARLCAVLRSWEDRYGIRVVALGFDVLAVSVAAPPTTLAEAEALAAEHFAFCPDNITESGSGKLADYAKGLVGESAWHFWWD